MVIQLNSKICDKRFSKGTQILLNKHWPQLGVVHNWVSADKSLAAAWCRITNAEPLRVCRCWHLVALKAEFGSCGSFLFLTITVYRSANLVFLYLLYLSNVFLLPICRDSTAVSGNDQNTKHRVVSFTRQLASAGLERFSSQYTIQLAVVDIKS